ASRSQAEDVRVEGAFPVTMLPGDGVGPELMAAVGVIECLKLGDGLFLQCCEEVAELYPKNIANPTATLLASCMMLDHLKTSDMGGYATCQDFTEAVIGALSHP
uniref:Isocitrate dehydrogenase [NAD] subunit beta, mitochondrial (Fragments) n=1 Tax=Sus scrofa TaxID=9823 RepID=IDH3B_PIG|nr:RecName: Full=Isocitrate dehydrogenase [NAD] subunit beta, mitochondrial; AltName: Full=Isocitric dehydrogenase subunit beta; AltName: Full=NAD(+)-specific ICDH subunit beta [Sus scrofa]